MSIPALATLAVLLGGSILGWRRGVYGGFLFTVLATLSVLAGLVYLLLDSGISFHQR